MLILQKSAKIFTILHSLFKKKSKSRFLLIANTFTVIHSLFTLIFVISNMQRGFRHIILPDPDNLLDIWYCSIFYVLST
jgi:hypothetical protein